MMRRLLWAAAILLGACKTPQPTDRPAIIEEPTIRSREAAIKAVSDALGGATVTLADDALTRSSVLIIDRTPLRDPSGLPVQGRETGMPERFFLVKNGPRCVLVHERTGKRYPLEGTSCVESK
jgi:hypothetical protein